MNKTKILIIEDEEAISDLLAYGLNKEGFVTATARTGAEGLRQVELFEPDLLLLDWMLPDMSGLDICKKVTASHNLPLILLTAKSDITDKILGLEFGADDYMTKPFDVREVVARIRTILRRVASADRVPDSTGSAEDCIRLHHLEINKSERTVVNRHRHELIELTPKEFDLLLTLIRHQGKVFTRPELLDFVWGYEYAGDTRTVDIHIQRLRKKLDAGELISTVFGVGYKFEKTADSRS
ncbi:winged helix-turn-helix domain-containing protein [Paenibacillus sp. TAB 01]|uniref:winged helix-turn-helix domain-containing protein n=1 Tax=Paenibacillus sp. TAB 01 TaxID=3368988 RepID=UPI0037514916